jgi:MOSC domain-containing protein YiiM
MPVNATRTFQLDALLASMPQRGRVEWIGLRPAKGERPVSRQSVDAAPGQGLAGDRFKGTEQSKRQVTLIQAEHLAAVASILGRESVDPALTRRNLVVSGINLYALRHAKFRVGNVLLEGTGICAPCANMELAFGPGGFNAMRGHGGITARVLGAGSIAVGDPVAVAEPGPLGEDEH